MIIGADNVNRWYNGNIIINSNISNDIDDDGHNNNNDTGCLMQDAKRLENGHSSA